MDNWGYFTQFHPEMELKRSPTYNDPLKRPIKRMIFFCQLFSRWGLRMREFSHRSFGEPELGGFQPIRRKGWNLVETTAQFLQIHPFSSKSQLLKTNFCAKMPGDLGPQRPTGGLRRGIKKGNNFRWFQALLEVTSSLLKGSPTTILQRSQGIARRFFFPFLLPTWRISSQLYSEFFWLAHGPNHLLY